MKKIRGFEYFVTKEGNVFSKKTQKYLKPNNHSCGYNIVHLRKNGKRHALYIHRLVLSTYKKKPPHAVVNHKNFNKKDNRLSNLEWVTSKENTKHAILGGRYSRFVGIKLEKEILELYKQNKRTSEISEILNIDKGPIWGVYRRHFSKNEIRSRALKLRPANLRCKKTGKFLKRI